MRNDSIETLLLRHYGSSAPAPANLEQKLCQTVRQEVAAQERQQQVANIWQQRRVSRRRVLQLVTFSGAGLTALAAGLNGLQSSKQKPAYSM